MIKKIIFIILFFTPSLTYSNQNQQRLFVKTFEVKQGITSDFAEKFCDKLMLYFFQECKNKYRILNESDIKIMYQQAEILLVTGCNAEKCLLEIAYIIDADLIIYGKIKKNEGKIHIFAQSLIRKRKENSLIKRSIVDISFYQFQMDWYVREIGKKLINPKYFIDKKKSPTEMKIELDIKEQKFFKIKGFNINILEFKTDDSTIAMVIDYLKKIVKKGDNYFKDQKYKSAFEKYQEAIEKIETKLPLLKQSKIKNLKDSVEDRIIKSRAMYYKTRIESIDKITKSNKQEEVLNQYEYIKKEFNRNEVVKTFRDRYPEYYTDWTDKQLWGNISKSPNAFKKAFPEYKHWSNKDIKQKLTTIEKRYKNRLNISINKAIQQRLNSIYMIVAKHKEKKR